MKAIQPTFHLVGFALIILFSAVACASQPAAPQSISRSHIDANIPAAADFEPFMERDLATYFSAAHGRPVTVTYQLLRSAPTQSGMSFPSFYAWVRISAAGAEIDQGAVEVDALYRKQFEVTYYASHADIFQDPDELYQHIPRAIADLILRIYAPCAPPKLC